MTWQVFNKARISGLLWCKLEAREEMPCLTKDCRNFIDRSMRRRLGDEGDDIAFLKIFLKMKECDGDFFYKVENDDEDWLRCMGDVVPKAIIIDQCKSIDKAIA
ncbi:unnamed protein product [Dovyalis caffra]|uniref:Uncharacterized protein n=1 Tax=Dovyalis caffra TaxID=77055 RepID=A0AAV1RGV1_9ROSI|nr:unnamed protein product [Dovyalis caffra]